MYSFKMISFIRSLVIPLCLGYKLLLIVVLVGLLHFGRDETIHIFPKTVFAMTASQARADAPEQKKRMALSGHGALLADGRKVEERRVMRILWWTTWYGKSSGFAGLHSLSISLRRLEKHCKFPCEFTTDRSLHTSSHAIVFHVWHKDFRHDVYEESNGSLTYKMKDVPQTRDEKQFYIYFNQEAPSRMEVNLAPYSYFFNWTISYRLDSHFPYPYGYFRKKTKAEIQAYDTIRRNSEIISKKRHLIAWIVSHCNASSRRDELAHELSKYVPVHVYGKCGTRKCRSKDCYDNVGPLYKFYLSFENALCLDYVTEKFFLPLKARMVPIVYGSANYGHLFPGSFINIDSFNSVQALAEYLRFLDNNDQEYLKYFKWRKYYWDEPPMDTKVLWCSVCEKLHRDYGVNKSIVNINEWLFNNDTGTGSPHCSEHDYIPVLNNSST